MLKKIVNTHLNYPFKLGLLKGGQLGRMLIQASINYDLQIWVMDGDSEAPCRNFSSQFVTGDARNFDDVCAFGRKVDMLTLEVEDIQIDALEQLEKEGRLVFPQSAVVKLIQDKGLQKKFYKENNFPTADFTLLEPGFNKEKYSNFLPAAQKLRKSGYDGKGVKMIHSMKDFDSAFTEPSLLERKIPFKKEISVLVARNHQGECAVYPPVELVSDPQKHLLDYLSAPADISAGCAKKAQDLSIAIVKKLGLVGLLAIEMFVDQDEQLFINEMAPRPHNSGHHTIEANETSQFEQHLRAILNLPLGSTAIKSPAVMVNILGEEGSTGTPIYEGIEKILSEKGVYIHLYGKSKTAPFRKMGHVTVLDNNLAKAREKAQWVKKTIRVHA